jgi:signal transduction histidine kinase
MTTLVLILGFGLATVVVSAVVVPQLPTLQLQLAALALLAVCLPVAVVLASGLVMFGMHHDVAILAIALASALSALVGAYLLGRRLLQPLGRLRTTSARLAEGELSARASESGPRELRELGASFNEMAENLERLFDARRQLFAWTSHDLRTPLASMQAMVEALEDGLADTADYLPALREEVRTHAARMLELYDTDAPGIERKDAI